VLTRLRFDFHHMVPALGHFRSRKNARRLDLPEAWPEGEDAFTLSRFHRDDVLELIWRERQTRDKFR
jgi:hypothetical protein